MVSPGLREHLTRRIRQAGPLPVSEFMTLALGHPEHGYYVTRDPFGAAGDFITAPEISQMFGELIGLCCVQHWRTVGGPPALALIELGPGRGTLMADALRAARLDPAFLACARIDLVETSPVLREAQAKALADTGLTPHWHDTLGAALAVAPGPPFIIANEFFDALPVRQFVRGEAGWHERMVGLDTDESGTSSFVFLLSPEAVPPGALDHAHAPHASEGELIEIAPARQALAAELATAIAARGGVGLIIDYGYARPGPGDTLQALRGHAPRPVLDDPGEADLTAHVDFDALARTAREAGAAVFGPLPQGEWLTRLGIRERAAMLARSNPARAGDIDSALARLTSADQMGSLFKVLAIGRKIDPAPPGFEAADRMPERKG